MSPWNWLRERLARSKRKVTPDVLKKIDDETVGLDRALEHLASEVRTAKERRKRGTASIQNLMDDALRQISRSSEEK